MNTELQKVVIVTGAKGFIGSHCALELFNRGYVVIGLDIQPFKEYKNWGMSEFVRTEIDIKILYNLIKNHGFPIGIIHCAGSGSVAASFKEPYFDFKTNVSTTLEILEFAKINKGKIKVILPSSAGVYGSVNDLPIKESGPMNPISPYGIHKQITERLAYSYANNFDVSIAIIRFFSVYGNGLKKQVLWDACCKAMDKNYNFSGHGTEIRDFIHVTDAAKLLVLAIEKASPACPVVNGGTGKGTTIKELLTIIGKCWNPEVSPVFSGEARAGDPEHYIADTSILRSWGFSPEAKLYDSIKKYVDWFQKEMSKND